MKYNAIIREYDAKSLKVLYRVRIADVNDFPDEFEIRYQAEPLDRPIDMEELCCSSTNPLQIYKPVENSFPIFVRTLDNRQLSLEAKKVDTVKLLKMKIFQENQSYPPHSQQIYFWRKGDSSELKDDETLETYGISSCSILFVNLKAKWFTQSLVKNYFKPIDFGSLADSRKTPSWSRYSVGINLSGFCPNEDCISRKDGEKLNVIIHLLEYGNLELDFADKKEALLYCPVCSTDKAIRLRKAKTIPDVKKKGEKKRYAFQIQPENLVVVSANLQMRYKMTDKTGVGRNDYQSKGTTEAVGQQYEVIKLDKNLGQVEVISVEPWRSPYVCVKCDTWITLKGDQCHMNCGHTYHTWCRPSSGLKGSFCKICASELLILGEGGVDYLLEDIYSKDFNTLDKMSKD